MARWLALGLLLHGLASAQEPDAPVAPTPAAYTRTVSLVDELYMARDEVTPEQLLHHAARTLARYVDWLQVDVDGGRVALRHATGRDLGVVEVHGWHDLDDALFGLEDAVRASGYAYGDRDLRGLVLSGLTLGLDRYSRILAGERLDRFDTRLKGTLVGIGATLRLVDDELVVHEVIAGSPAALGGMRPDDVLTAIDGRSTTSMPVSEAVRRIRGEPGTSVEVQLTRRTLDPVTGAPSTETSHTLELSRARVILPNVEHSGLPGGVGYVRIDNISQKTVYNLRRALAELVSAGDLRQGLVLDLRQNTGGSMKESAGVVDQFVQSGEILRTAGRDGGPVKNLMHRIEARNAGDEPPLPVVVLVSPRTASAAEIITGALLSWDRIAVLGQRTYGKGRVQKIYDVEEGRRLKLTVAEYVLAGGLRVTDDGLPPDVSFGEITLDEEGVRFGTGWDIEREAVAWESVVPIVEETPGWRQRTTRQLDVPVELARLAVLEAPTPDRAGLLTALEALTPRIRRMQEAHLTEALESAGIDWSAAPRPGPTPVAEVSLSLDPDPLDPLRQLVRARVTNLGDATLYRTLVRLRSDAVPPLDDLVVAVGAVPPRGTARGDISVRLPSGVLPRTDLVAVELRADQRPTLDLGEQLLELSTPAPPPVRVEARLEGEGAERTAVIAVDNLGTASLSDVEVRFAWSDELDVELLDRAARTPRIDPQRRGVHRLHLRLGPDAPRVLPLELRLTAHDHPHLGSWTVPLHVEGHPVVRESPRITPRPRALSAPVGEVVVPIEITDDRALASVVVFHDDDKLVYAEGDDSRRLVVRPRLGLREGANEILVKAVDADGSETQVRFTLLGLDDGEAVATSPDED